MDLMQKTLKKVNKQIAFAQENLLYNGKNGDTAVISIAAPGCNIAINMKKDGSNIAVNIQDDFA